ncbi:MAG: hypothetical protein RLZZ546_2224 [Bacteroidota bacterium]|jgi:imidazolonepropionase-like amidohydrolase
MRHYSNHVWFLLLSIITIKVNAQQEIKIEVTKNYFIKNAFVVSKPGSPATLQSVLIKDGIVSQLGSNIKPPYDCKIIDVDSMYMYAGFIDAMSYIGVKKEEEKKDAPKPASRGVANYEQSGITPQINALSKINPKESSIADFRKAGFTISQVFPRGKMIAGSASIVSLKEVDHEDKMLLNYNTAMQHSFVTSGGNAPSTLIGVIAKYKDFYKNTDISIKNLNTYNINSLGLKKPIFSEEQNAMIPVIKKEMPVYFIAEKSKDIYRALELQKELGFKMVLAEVKQFDEALLPSFKSNGQQILLSIDLPDEIKEEEKKEEVKKGEAENKDSKKEEKIAEKKEKSPEEKAREERKKQAYDRYLKQASLLEKNAILFGFSYLDAKPSDILKGVKRLVKAGLSEASALSALTTTPAQYLNLSKSAGTIESGKMANLVLIDKPIFDEKSEIKYVVVDGVIFDYNEKKKPTQSTKSDESIKIEGDWSYTVEVPGQIQTGKITFTKSGVNYSGSSINDQNQEKSNLEKIEVNGDKVTCEMSINMGQPTTVTFDLTFVGDSYSGTVSVGQLGSFPINGNKISGPK